MKPGFVKIVFDYPFHIGVPDGFYPANLNGNELAMVQVTAKEGTQLFDKGNVLRNKRGENGNPIVDVEPISPKNPKNAQMIGSGEDDQPLFHIIAGEAGKVLYPWFFSEIGVIFSINDVQSAWSNPENSKFLRKNAISVFNKFLLAYKHTAHDYYNKFLSEDQDLTFYTTVYISEFSDEEINMTTIDLLEPTLIKQRIFLPFPMVLNMQPDDIPIVQGRATSPLLMNVKKPMIPAERILSLMAGSAGAYNIAIFNQIFLAGLERMAFDKDYRVCIIEFDTAVEIAVLTYLVGALQLQGLKTSEIEDLLDDESKQAKKLAKNGKGYLTTNSKIRRLEENINVLRQKKQLPIIKLYDTDEHKNWKMLVRKKRNAGVHQWENFGKEDAAQALEAAQKFVRLIENIGNETLKQ